MLFCLQAEEDFFSTVVYTELAPLETAMIVSQVWKHNRAIWEKFNHLGSNGIIAQQSYLRKVKVSLFTWNRCSTTWRQRAWVSGQPLGWPRSRNATPRNEQVLWMINCFYFFLQKLWEIIRQKYFHSSDSKFTGTGEPLPGQLWTTTLPLPKKVEPIPMQVCKKSMLFKI